MSDSKDKAGKSPATTRLVLRRRTDGSTELTAAPDQHVLPARFVAREIETGLLEVTVTFNTDAGDPVTYDLTGFDVIDEKSGQVDHGAWKLTKRNGGN